MKHLKLLERGLFLLPDNGANDINNSGLDDGTNDKSEHEDQDGSIESGEDIEESEEADEYQEENDTVPLATFLEMKKQNKELKKKVSDKELQDLTDNLKARRESIKQKWLDKGYDEDFAEGLADDFIETQKELNDEKINTKVEKRIDEELEELSESDDFYKDIKNYKKDIVKTVKEYKNKGIDITLEEAFIKKVGLTNRLNELRTNMSIENQYGKKKKSSKKVGNSSSTGNDNIYKLDEKDQKALKGLQQAQPNSNWTPEKYYKMLKKKE